MFCIIENEIQYSLEKQIAWKQNLQKAFDFGINHISSYALTVEPKTALDTFIKNGKYPPLNEELAAEHFDILVEELEFLFFNSSNGV